MEVREEGGEAGVWALPRVRRGSLAGQPLLWPEARARMPVARLRVSPSFWAEKPLRAGLLERLGRGSALPRLGAELELRRSGSYPS